MIEINDKFLFGNQGNQAVKMNAWDIGSLTN